MELLLRRPVIKHVKHRFTQPRRGPFSVVRLGTFYGCQCDAQLLQGEHALRARHLIVEAAQKAKFTVIGGYIDLYGETWLEQAANGWTVGCSFAQSGLSADAWHKAYPPNGTVDFNVHWCDEDAARYPKGTPALGEHIEEAFWPLAMAIFHPLEVDFVKRTYRVLERTRPA